MQYHGSLSLFPVSTAITITIFTTINWWQISHHFHHNLLHTNYNHHHYHHLLDSSYHQHYQIRNHNWFNSVTTNTYNQKKKKNPVNSIHFLIWLTFLLSECSSPPSFTLKIMCTTTFHYQSNQEPHNYYYSINQYWPYIICVLPVYFYYTTNISTVSCLQLLSPPPPTTSSNNWYKNHSKI